jgi:NAD(P)-dependent dehydrogenase (short-subunit alcohol dehydrogenase family)
MRVNFLDKVVLVAGGTGGLGRAVSVAFVEAGAKVVVTYRKAEEFAALLESAGSKASSLEGHQIDVSDEGAVGQMMEGVVAKYGRLDAMVNTIGGYAGGTKLWELETKVLQQMLQLNLLAGYALSRAAVKPMLAQKHGAIVNVAAKAAVDHGAGAAAYAASKAAAVAMMDSLAGDVKGTGVRVNSILPSIIDTVANRKAMPGADFAVWPKTEDIANVVLFLCSDEARVIHGAAIPVYGDS